MRNSIHICFAIGISFVALSSSSPALFAAERTATFPRVAGGPGSAQSEPAPLTPAQQQAEAALSRASADAKTVEQMRALAARADMGAALVRGEILRLVSERRGEITATEQGAAFWRVFLDDQQWMETFLCSASVANAPLSLKYLSEIWASDP